MTPLARSILLVLFLAAPAAFAQDHPLAEAEAAFAEGRFEAALALAQQVAASENDPEAWLLVARIHHETPLANRSAALRAIREARRIEPENTRYMTAELVQMRESTWNNLAELIAQEERRVLANRILALDSTNAVAHEELGALLIRDYWFYRNAIRLPGLSFAPHAPGARGVDPNPDPTFLGISSGDASANTPQLAQSDVQGDPFFAAPGAVAGSDRFNLRRFAEQGVGVQDLSARAEAVYGRASGHLEAALRHDPRRRPVYDHLMRLRVLHEHWTEAADMLDQMVLFFPDDAGTWLYQGTVNHRLGRADAAQASFDQALARMDADERAAFESIDWLLSGDERRAYRADPEGFSRAFWAERNPRFLTPYNERRLEHFARLVHADLLYAAPDINRRGWETQRGQILVRYGPPEVDVVITDDFEEALHAFGVRAGAAARAAGYTFDMASRSNLFNIWDYGDFRFVFEDPVRNNEYRLYSPPADLYVDGTAGRVERNDYELIARQTFRETPERYEYAPPGRAVELPYVVSAFKGEDGQADLYVHYGLPLSDQAATGETVDLTLLTGAFLLDTERGTLAERRRTVYGLRTAQIVHFAETALWADTQPLRAAAGPHVVSVEVEAAGGAVQGTQRRAIDVPDFHGDRLAVSDLLLAYQVEEVFEDATPAAAGWVQRGDVQLFPAPWSVFGRTQPLYLYFEPYQLAVGPDGRSRYTVEVTLREKDTRTGLARVAGRLFGGRDRGVSVEFEAEGMGPDDRQYTILDVADQEPGLYTLTLRIRDQLAGRSVERERDLFLE